MSHVYNPSSAGSLVLGYTLPDDNVDKRAAASVNVPMQGLGDDIARLAAGKITPINNVFRTYADFVNTDGGWARIQTGWQQSNVTTQVWLCPSFDFPHGSVLTGLQFGIIGAAGHSALPANMPQFQLYKKNVSTGVVTNIGSVTVDSSASTTAYQASHFVTLSGLSETIDRTINVYEAWFQGEWAASGTGCIAGLKMNGAIGSFNLSATDQGAG